MALSFEWDENKARSNLAKHGIGFDEASTVFSDPASVTISDPDHSQGEDRFIILGNSHRGKLLVVVHTERGDNIAASAHGTASRRERKMYEEKNESEMQAEYDSSGVRGKYSRRCAEGTNVVVLEPDVVRVFPNAAP